ncbi:EamA family transporter RarD [Suttonella ornithocola]|uniref:Putative chloramphenical resistance permease RarD n=1 Tax=Suttonella ornithocola TaxID=279832 RepID=A0A380MWK2_9GAMM|nr:EamA family transporter RarD [Suttonella ornithocola]SUO96949.1 putative chloramphenical resistance permease RarD [Suttonella ornithocola]
MTMTIKAWIALSIAFITWGAFPLFVRAMDTMRADEFLYVRIVFSFLCLLLLYAWKGKLKSAFQTILRPHFLLQASISAVFIALNWYLYIVAVNENLTTQASIGYFITPLINVLFGVWLFGDKMDIWKATALGFGLAGVIYQMIALHIMPWLPLGIGAAFGIYGSLRKKMRMPPVQGLFAELLVMLPIVLLAWAALVEQGKAFNYAADPSMILWCIAAGLITLIPLLLFLYAVNYLSLTAVGFAQYSSPSIQFLIAIFYFHEPFSISRLIAFILIWIGLAIYSVRLLQMTRRKKYDSH